MVILLLRWSVTNDAGVVFVMVLVLSTLLLTVSKTLYCNHFDGYTVIEMVCD